MVTRFIGTHSVAYIISSMILLSWNKCLTWPFGPKRMPTRCLMITYFECETNASNGHSSFCRKFILQHFPVMFVRKWLLLLLNTTFAFINMHWSDIKETGWTNLETVIRKLEHLMCNGNIYTVLKTCCLYWNWAREMGAVAIKGALVLILLNPN